MNQNNNDPTQQALADDQYADMWIKPPFSASSSLHQGLRDMEENLRCIICGDFMTSPVSVSPCHHTFCSLCVQNHGRACVDTSVNKFRKGHVDCPCCRVKIAPAGTDLNRHLHPNPTVERMVENFRGMRSQLKQVLLLLASTNSSSSNGTTGSSDSSSAQALQQAMALTEQVEEEATGRRKRARKNYAESNDDDDSSSSDQDNDEKVEQPPLEEQKQAAKPQQQQQHSYAKPMKSTIYSNIKNKKAMKDLLAKAGLPQTGDMKQMEERHRLFVRLNNSYHSHSIEGAQKTQQEIVQEVIETERNKTLEANKSLPKQYQQAFQQLIVVRERMGKDDKVPAGVHAYSGIPWFDKELKQNYEKLIANENLRREQLPKQTAANNTTTTAKKSPPSETSSSPPPHQQESSEASSTSIPPAASAPAASSTSVASASSSSVADNKRKSGTSSPSSSSSSEKPPQQEQPPLPISATQMAYDPEAVAAISNNNINTSAIFSPNDMLATPALPKWFQEPGSNAPSTISHKQSQEGPSVLALAHDNNMHMMPLASAHASHFSPEAPSTTNSLQTAAAQQSTTALAETNANANNKINPNQNTAKKRRSPTTLMDVGITKTRRTVPPAAAAPAPAPTRRSARSTAGPWPCQMCTFLNKKRTYSTARCQMCNSKRSEQGLGATMNENVQEATVSL